MAGIDAPGRGRIAVGGVPLVDLDLPTPAGKPPWSPRSITSSSARRGQPTPAAARGERRRALEGASAADADGSWAAALPDGLPPPPSAPAVTPSPRPGPGPAALPRPTGPRRPHTLVLDEATSLLDPRAAHATRAIIGRRRRRSHGGGHCPPACTPPTTPIGSASWRRAGSPSSAPHDELLAADGSYRVRALAHLARLTRHAPKAPLQQLNQLLRHAEDRILHARQWAEPRAKQTSASRRRWVSGRGNFVHRGLRQRPEAKHPQRQGGRAVGVG